MDVDDTTEALISYGTGFLVVAVTVAAFHKYPRSQGKNIKSHITFFMIAAAVILFVPDYIQNVIFSQGGVLVIGTIVPIYESIRAVCTIEEADDTAWLQYWISSGIFTYCTEWMDIIAEKFPLVAERWYELEFLTLLWLLLPFTDGSGFVYNHVTMPYISPVAKSLKEKLDGKFQLIVATTVNSSYLWVVWMAFMTMEEEARRFVVVAVGTVYPLAASTVAVTTKSSVGDDTFWLTYWSCFSVLFIMMDYLENFVGSIRGFYSLCLCATVYLFLPMFEGANSVFRCILVPLSGQYENMLLRDAYLVRMQMEKKLPKDARKDVLMKAAEVFLKNKEE